MAGNQRRDTLDGIIEVTVADGFAIDACGNDARNVPAPMFKGLGDAKLNNLLRSLYRDNVFK